jgi:D-psicose/D-tagatose/L-ribulose 3-epimerase
MRFGINTFLFTSPFTNRSTRLLAQFKRWGLDSVEIAVEDSAHINPKLIRTNSSGLWKRPSRSNCR